MKTKEKKEVKMILTEMGINPKIIIMKKIMKNMKK